jgi:tRNA A-37 threonylcarbamoyl transferase component Bud32/tetratricopeptide (TPR) repeat protein
MSETPPPEGQAPAKELSGQRIGKYDAVKPLGKGAMGMVYLAHDTVLERDVALKVMVAQIADDPELRKRFEREAKAVAKMTHPNVVMVFDLGYHDGSPYIAMELLKGQDLQKAMRSTPPMTLERKVGVIVQVLAGLAHAHQAGIVHRDIKPANIFINQDGAVKIMDFGVARLTTASMTGTGNIVGTADYMSPEQVKGAHVDGRSDVFSVGCMLYELLAGRRPFHSDNLMAIFYKITHEEPNFDLIPGGAEHDALLPILKKALNKDLEQRYQSAYEFAVELRDYLKSHATSASAEHALEDLVDLEAPSAPAPAPLGEAQDATVVPADATESSGATVDLSRAPRAATLGRSGGETVRGASAPTVLGAPGTRAQGATVVGAPPGAPTRLMPSPARPVSRPPVRPAPQPSGSPVLYVVLGGMGVLLAVAGGFIYWKTTQPVPSPPPTVASLAPSTTVATTLPPTTVPPTAAPPPTFAVAAGRAATALRDAQTAFRSGDYERALTQAQAALREDPGNADGQKLADNALQGRKAQERFRAAETALARGDFAQAQSEAEAGRSAAPWDGRGPGLLERIQSTQQRVQQEAAQKASQQQQQLVARQTGDLLGKADAALSDQKYDAAIALYDEVLKLDPQSQRATLGKTSAVGARAMAIAAASGTGRTAIGRAFVSGKTQAQSVETRAGSVPEGFEETAGVTVKRGSQAAELPGKITFDVEPAQIRAGDRYTVKINLLNEGSAPIQIKEMIITSTVNGKKQTGAVPSLVKDVAPQQRAMLLSLGPDVWKEDVTSWAMEVAVRTVRGETYRNAVSWK